MVSALIADLKAQGVSGGTFASGAWQTRDINTIVVDLNSLVTLTGANRFRLKAGRYYYRAEAPTHAVNRHQARLFNVTQNTLVNSGTPMISYHSYSGANFSTVQGLIISNGTDEYILQHQCETTVAVNGFGMSGNFAEEVYSTIWFHVAGS